MIAIDLRKQQVLDANLKPMHQINFAGNITRIQNENTTIIFIIEEAKGII